jgi:SAM-dependent methyltransferase
MICRHCSSPNMKPVIDLGSSPPSNAYLLPEDLTKLEKWFPLKVNVCNECFLVQTEDYSNADELFDGDYAYFSSFSKTMLDHSKRYVDDMVERLSLNEDSMVIEIAANDGYLLQFVKEQGIPCLGIEPTKSTAEAARSKGIEIVEEFFGVALAKKLVSKGFSADLMASNNVLAHVPDINDFVEGYSLLLKPNGVATFEFPYLVNLFEKNQFDTIYHEHYSYLSLTAVNTIFSSNGLHIFDVEQIDTHGGSLRVFAERNDSLREKCQSKMVNQLLAKEKVEGYLSERAYVGFQGVAEKAKDDLVKFLITAKEEGKSVCAFGAAAKGNTFINFAGIRPDLISAVADSNPAKQGKFMPGSRIPIVSEEVLASYTPDYVIILPWNLKEEISARLDYMREWGCSFVVGIPELKIL